VIETTSLSHPKNPEANSCILSLFSEIDKVKGGLTDETKIEEPFKPDSYFSECECCCF
jgi:hypothetical protein